MSVSPTPLRLKVIEINNSFSDPDILIADEDANIRAVMLGTEAVYGQVADRLTGDVIVKSVNLFPDMADYIRRCASNCAEANDLLKRIEG